MARPLTQSDLIFPTQSISISSTLQSLKRSALSITNRLSSISADSEFVASVSVAYGLPLVANERCGSWYIPPEKKAESVYFKSTDGHTGEWGFSLRRLNLQVLGTVGKFGGYAYLIFRRIHIEAELGIDVSSPTRQEGAKVSRKGQDVELEHD